MGIWVIVAPNGESASFTALSAAALTNADTVVNTRDYGMDYSDRANIATVTMSATGDLTIWFYSAGNAADFALSRPQAHYAWSNGVVSAAQWQGGAVGVSIGGTWQ